MLILLKKLIFKGSNVAYCFFKIMFMLKKYILFSQIVMNGGIFSRFYSFAQKLPLQFFSGRMLLVMLLFR